MSDTMGIVLGMIAAILSWVLAYMIADTWSMARRILKKLGEKP